MKLLAFIFLISCACARAQLATLAQQYVAPAAPPAAGFNPTNIAGYAAWTYAWYCVESNYSSASGSATLGNLCANLTNAASLDLTNRATGTGKQPTLEAASLNGYSAIYFDGSDDYLQQLNHAVPQPFEVFLVMSNTMGGIVRYIIGDGNANTYLSSSATDGTLYRCRLEGTAREPGFLTTNKWFVLDVIGKGSSSQIFTNNTQVGGNINPGTGSISNLSVAAALGGGGSWQKMRLAEMAIYSTNLDTATRSNVFYYLTNKYAIAP